MKKLTGILALLLLLSLTGCNKQSDEIAGRWRLINSEEEIDEVEFCDDGTAIEISGSPEDGMDRNEYLWSRDGNKLYLTEKDENDTEALRIVSVKEDMLVLGKLSDDGETCSDLAYLRKIDKSKNWMDVIIERLRGIFGGRKKAEDLSERESYIEEEAKPLSEFEKLKEKAIAGDASAQNNLGLCYEKGDGVTKDMAEAAKWYRKAAEQGHAGAQNKLGVCYEDGKGVTKDMAEAEKWYRKAAEQDNMYAQYNLGLCYKYGKGVMKDMAEAAKWYRKAAEQGHASAQDNLGLCYELGDGVTKDMAEAVKWYRKAAEQGNMYAQRNLGLCYKYGKGVTKDLAEAVKWYEKAAEQGYAEAQNSLGLCYENGDGVTKDLSEAVRWYRKAAEQGNEKAKEALERLNVAY